MNKNQNILIISVKPEYAKKILTGEKTIELRKSAPKKVGVNDFLFLYVTSPIMELWGIYQIENIIKEVPQKLWMNHGEKTGINKTEFTSYFSKSKNAYGIQLKEIKNFSNLSIKLNDLKKVIPGFMPPQTYSYIKSEVINYKFLKDLISSKKSVANNG